MSSRSKTSSPAPAEVVELKDGDDQLRPISAAWIKQWAESQDSNYDTVIDGLTEYLNTGRTQQSWDLTAWGEELEELWRHYEIIMRTSVPSHRRQDSPWECCP